MKNKTGYLILGVIVTALLMTLTACSSKNETNKGMPKISTSACDTADETAKEVFEEYLSYYEGSPKDKKLKIDDYKINRIVVLQDSGEELYFFCDYCVKSNREDWIVGNGVKGDEGWINNKVAYVVCSKKDGKISLKEVNTTARPGTDMNMVNEN